ncbi:hypothetical protein ACUJ46_03160 [Sandaracinobacteroides sp. A072]|uniref:hypothetical protein n=1 Tax=Sandaracinobacteroides sp. A072 TaxID=3461146 RepID=UPI0040437AA8
MFVPRPCRKILIRKHAMARNPECAIAVAQAASKMSESAFTMGAILAPDMTVAEKLRFFRNLRHFLFSILQPVATFETQVYRCHTQCRLFTMNVANPAGLPTAGSKNMVAS